MHGALPKKVDLRNYKISGSAQNTKSVLEEFQITGFPMPIKNQQSVNSCVAHALSTILEYYAQTDELDSKLSTDFIYGSQYFISGRKGSGMYLLDACKCAQEFGDAPYEMCPTNTEMPDTIKFVENILDDDNKRPYIYQYLVDNYAACSTSDDIKYAITTYGPVLASVKWYQNSYVDADTHILNSNYTDEFDYHAIVIYGWNKSGFLCQNSWGNTWGNDGTFILPYEHKVEEAYSFVDAENTDIVVPKNNSFLNFLYKVCNLFLNIGLTIIRYFQNSI